jgi:hypothetical protein
MLCLAFKRFSCPGSKCLGFPSTLIQYNQTATALWGVDNRTTCGVSITLKRGLAIRLLRLGMSSTLLQCRGATNPLWGGDNRTSEWYFYYIYRLIGCYHTKCGGIPFDA